VLIETLAGIAAGTLKPAPQDHARATLAPIIKKEDGRLDWTMPAEALARRVRGFHPWPGTFTTWRGQPLKVLRARAEAGGALAPGELAVDRDGLLVGCGQGTRLRLLDVQPESRRPMTAAAFAAGLRLAAGARFD
jgi:methionyl-tRNA formyltransferase